MSCSCLSLSHFSEGVSPEESTAETTAATMTAVATSLPAFLCMPSNMREKLAVETGKKAAQLQGLHSNRTQCQATGTELKGAELLSNDSVLAEHWRRTRLEKLFPQPNLRLSDPPGLAPEGHGWELMDPDWRSEGFQPGGAGSQVSR